MNFSTNKVPRRAITGAFFVLLSAVCVVAATHVGVGNSKISRQMQAEQTDGKPAQIALSGKRSKAPRYAVLPPQLKSVKIRAVESHANYPRITDVSKLEMRADLVVLATPTQDFLDRRHLIAYHGDGEIDSVGTEGLIQIKAVLKSNDGFTAKEAGPTMTIIEPIGLVENKLDGGVNKLTTEGYQEMRQGSDYVLFLKKNKLGSYTVQNFNLGKFNVDGTDPYDVENRLAESHSKAQTGLPPTPDTLAKLDMKQQIQQRYHNRL